MKMPLLHLPLFQCKFNKNKTNFKILITSRNPNINQIQIHSKIYKNLNHIPPLPKESLLSLDIHYKNNFKVIQIQKEL
jgi:hypothetical protein